MFGWERKGVYGWQLEEVCGGERRQDMEWKPPPRLQTQLRDSLALFETFDCR